MAVRVVVTGVDADGVSRVERDGPAEAEVTLSSSGMVLTYPWQVAVPPKAVEDGGEPEDGVGPFVPPSGFLNFFEASLPPGYPAPLDDDGLQALMDEVRLKLPGLLPTIDPAKGRGMHRTPTLDLVTVVSGRLVLRLDDGSSTELAPG
jgi:hypothetical protein